MEKINNIPKGWKEYKLGEVCDINLGLTHTPIYVEEGIPFVSVKDISNTKLELSTTKRISRAEFESFPKGAKPRKGDVLFCRVGTIGHSQIVTTDEPFGIFVSVGFLRMKSSSIINKYIKYWMDSYCFTSQVEMEVKGGTRKNLNTGWLKNFSISIPPTIDEQSTIVSRIESSFSRLDSGIATLQKVQKQLAVYRQAVLKEAFEGCGEKKKVKLVEITDDIKIGPFGTMLHKEDYIANGIPVINPQHIKNGQIVPNDNISVSLEKYNELSSYKVKKNDIIMGRRGEMGRCAPISEKEDGWLCGTGSILFRLKENFDAIFYAKILSSPTVVHYLEENATGTTMKNLNEKIVRNIPVPYITRQEQAEITNAIESRLSVCDSIEKTVTESLRQAEVLRQSILKEAFEGKWGK